MIEMEENAELVDVLEMVKHDAGIFAQISRSKYRNILGLQSANLSEIH